MRVRGRKKQLLSTVSVCLFLLLFYTWYMEKSTFQDLGNETIHLDLHSPAKNTIGKVIKRNKEGWTIVTGEICQMQYDFVLAHLKNPPNTPIFVYSDKVDKYVSKDIIKTGAYEGYNVDIIVKYMHRFPNAVFIDIGANIGAFSVTVAALGYRVVAIDCLRGNVMRLCASMKRAKVTDKLTVIYNPVAAEHKKVSLETAPGNIGLTYLVNSAHRREAIDTIILDDLLEIYDFKRVVIKMDVESLEYAVLKGANKFFDRVRVEALMMEFLRHQHTERGKLIIDFLAFHGLEADVPSSLKNDYNRWNTNEIVFKQTYPDF